MATMTTTAVEVATMDEGDTNNFLDIAKAYVRLAEAVLVTTRADYEKALEEGNIGKVRKIEGDLLTKEFEILTFGKVDFGDYINTMRRKYGVEERVW